jgi:hypothetical protein
VRTVRRVGALGRRNARHLVLVSVYDEKIRVQGLFFVCRRCIHVRAIQRLDNGYARKTHSGNFGVRRAAEKIPIREKIYGVDLFPECTITTIRPPQTHASNDAREFSVELAEFLRSWIR